MDCVHQINPVSGILKEQDINKRFSFISVRNPDQRIKEFWNTINSKKVSCNILVDANVGTCEIDAGNDGGLLIGYTMDNGFITTHQILEITNITTTAGAQVIDRALKALFLAA